MPYTTVSPFTPSIRPSFRVVWDYLERTFRLEAPSGMFFSSPVFHSIEDAHAMLALCDEAMRIGAQLQKEKDWRTG